MPGQRPAGPGRLTAIVFAAAGLFTIALAAFTFWISRQQLEAAGWIAHTHEVMLALDDVTVAVGDIESGPRGYAISAKETFLARYQGARHSLDSGLVRLRVLTADNAEQRERVTQLEPAVRARVKLSDELIAARRTAGFGAAQQLINSEVPQQQSDAIYSLLVQMDQTERHLLQERLETQAQQVQLFWTAIGTLVAALLIAFTVLFFVIRRRQQGVEQFTARLEERVRERTASLDEANLRLTAEVEERREAESELHQARERLRSLSQRLIKSNEDERRRIARDLHDQTGQALSLMLQNLRVLIVGHDEKRVKESMQLVEAMIRQVRDVSMRLRPPMLDDLGLDAAVEWLLERQAQAAGWTTTLETDELPEDLAEDVRTECFRIAQEALTNASKHAGAKNVQVTLRARGDTLELTVRDDGKGFSAEQLRSSEERAQHFGLLSMTERAHLGGGSLEIAPASGGGTEIRVLFPMRRRAAETEAPGASAPS